MKRWLLPVIAAVAVLALVAGVWWLAGDGSDGGPDGSVAGGSSAEPGDPGPSEPGSSEPGDEEPLDPGPDPGPDPGQPDSNPRGVPIESYYAYDERRLAINYTIGVPACYGTIDRPEVTETARAVIVTLTRIPPTNKGDVACIDIALLKSVDIRLDRPLGDRVVRDGSFSGSVVPPGARADDPLQEK